MTRGRLHQTARKHLTEPLPKGLRVCEAVLVEACFHLPHPAQRRRLAATLEELRIDSVPTGDPEFRAEVFAWPLKYADHEPDCADGCIAVLCGRDKKLKVWTYDLRVSLDLAWTRRESDIDGDQVAYDFGVLRTRRIFARAAPRHTRGGITHLQRTVKRLLLVESRLNQLLQMLLPFEADCRRTS